VAPPSPSSIVVETSHDPETVIQTVTASQDVITLAPVLLPFLLDSMSLLHVKTITDISPESYFDAHNSSNHNNNGRRTSATANQHSGHHSKWCGHYGNCRHQSNIRPCPTVSKEQLEYRCYCWRCGRRCCWRPGPCGRHFLRSLETSTTAAARRRPSNWCGA
jgi:hypothetical protein